MAINVGYFGLSLNTSNLSGDPFMNCFLSAAAEVPAYVVSTWLLRTCPRKALLSSFLVIGGGVLLLIQFIPNSEMPFNAQPQSQRLVTRPQCLILQRHIWIRGGSDCTSE